MATPGHTPSCVSYRVGDAVFVGDTMFMPDYGSARCDFPEGDARTLYHSVKRILALPPQTRLFMCHDYGPNGRPYRWETTVAEQRAENIHLHDGIDEEAFVRLRRERDAGLDMPALILPAIQVNIRAGAFPPAEENGVSYLKIPLNAL
jgi:glyoxylase-like metal-dependent hydrolase (beta-lactamase superfamily II)